MKPASIVRGGLSRGVLQASCNVYEHEWKMTMLTAKVMIAFLKANMSYSLKDAFRKASAEIHVIER